MKQISKKDKEIPILSFFTGLGLLDLGFHQAGFQSIWHNEIDKHFVKGFEHGMNAYGIEGRSSKIEFFVDT